ncbi:peptide ABC transporter substrate-binding protein [Christensenellaceae bacterium OttesenSCG-928-L17]|nr:peptide ABC transporter substrate-binding protein [Christensenellaceae bacterium OttesenSCG-928-L17]
MRNTKNFIRTLSSVLVLLLLFSGCKKAPAPVEQTPVALATGTPAVQPAVGGELIIPIPRNPFIMDDYTGANPLLVNTDEMRNMYSLVYDTLLRCDANNRLVPGLAERWSVDETGKVWTLTLRENVLFHMDNDLFGADDVLYTISQIRALAQDSYYGWIGSVIASQEKVDERTVRITMKTAGTASLYALLFPVVCANDTSGQLNGTGLYKLSHASGSMIELTANLQSWRQKPYIQTIRCLMRDSNDIALDSYEAGQLNFVPTTNVSAGKYRDADATTVIDMMSQDCEVMLVNHKNSRLRDLTIRKAIACAINRSAIVSNVYMNRAEVSDVPVPPDSFLYDPTSKIYDYNDDTAAAYFAEAGWTEKNEDGILVKNGQPFTLRLLVSDSAESTYRKSVAGMVAQQLQEIGIAVEVETAKLTIGTENEFESRLEAGDFDLALAGFNLSRSGDLSAYLSAGGARNYGGYTSDTLELYLRAAAIAVEEKDMREAHAKLQQAFVQELPFIVLGFRKSSVVYSAKIQGVADVRAPDVLRTVNQWYLYTA